MIIIGLTGVARSGKDTVADRLVERHGFEKRSFAAPLKQMLRRLDPIIGPLGHVRLSDLANWSEDEIKGSEYANEYRQLLQRLGTDCVRAVDDQFWVRAAMESLDNEKGRYVFTDCRFPNEAQSIQRTDGYLWCVTRPGVAAVNGHVSEQHAGNMDEDEFIHNNGTLQRLYDQVDFYVDRLALTPLVKE